MKKKFLIIAGEVSGDRHAADLVFAMKKRESDSEFVGIGGDQLERAGVKLLYHISQLAILGFAEIIRHIPFIRKVFKDIKKESLKGIDAAILVDYPGFNLRLARMLKRQGIPVIYYICPQMWAWAENRIEKFRKYVDLPLVIFKFEEDFFSQHGIKAYFVGHPLVDQIPKNIDEMEFRLKYKISPTQRIVGLFPGSREMEVKRIFPVMVESISELKKSTDMIAVVAKAPHLDVQLYEKFLPNHHDFKIVDSDTHRLMKVSYAALVASGTATLELGYLQTPSIVLYIVSPLTYWLGRSMIKIKNIALANIVMGKAIFPEFIQSDAKVGRILSALNRLFFEEEYYQNTKKELARIKETLGEAGAAERAAGLIINFVNGEKL